MAVWDEATNQLVMAEQTGPTSPKLRTGQIVPVASAIYTQWAYNKPFSIVPDQKLAGATSVALHPDTRSEVIFLLRAGGRRRAILNVESFEQRWFGEESEQFLELLEPFAIQAIEGLNAASFGVWPPSPPGIGWFRVRHRLGCDRSCEPLEQVTVSVSPSCADMFGLSPTAKMEDYQRLTDQTAWNILQAAILRAVLEGDRGIEKLSKMQFKINPASRPPSIVKFFGALRRPGEVVCTLQDVTDEFAGLENEAGSGASDHSWKDDMLSWLRISCSRGNGTYLHVSEATAKMYGYASLEEFRKDIGNAVQLYAEEMRRRVLIGEIKTRGFVDGFEFLARKNPNTVSGRPAEAWISQDVRCHRVGTDPDHWQLFACFTDISDRKAMERKLCMAGVAGVLLHEAEKPFVTIKNNLRTLRLSLDQHDYGECQSLIPEIIEICDKGMRQAEDWLKVAKGRKDPGIRPQELMSNLYQFANEARSLYGVETQIVGELPPNCYVKYNTAMLGFAFQQLFKNVRAGKTNEKRCTMTVRFNDPYVEITIDDEGPGFGENNLGAGWKAIAELDKKTSGGEEKGGLGLVMCNAVVEIHHGEMSLSNWFSDDKSRSGARVRLIFHCDQTFPARAELELRKQR